MSQDIIHPNLQKEFIYETLRELSAGVAVSKIIDTANFPQGSIQVYGGSGADAPTGLTGTIEMSNMEDGAWVPFATFTQANLATAVGPAPNGTGGFVFLPVGVRYWRVNVTALAGGKVGAVVHIPVQS